MRFHLGFGGMCWGTLLSDTAVPADPPRAEPARCPRCWSRDCAPGRPIARFDGFFLRLHRVPWECRGCGCHFRVFDRAGAARMAAELAADFDRLDAARHDSLP